MDKPKGGKRKVETKEQAEERMTLVAAGLEKFSKKLKTQGEEIVDLDDEENSSFLVLDRMNKKYADFAKEFASGLKVVDIRRNISLPDNLCAIETRTAVEKFINSRKLKKSWNQPDRKDIYDVITEATKATSLTLQLQAECESIFKYVHRKIKSLRKRRLRDLHQPDAMPEIPPELEERMSAAGTLDENINKFIQKFDETEANTQDESATSSDGSDEEVEDQTETVSRKNNEVSTSLSQDGSTVIEVIDID